LVCCACVADREVEFSGPRAAGQPVVVMTVSAPVAAQAVFAGSSLTRLISLSISSVGLVVSRPMTGVRQTVLDVICGSIAVFRRRSRFGCRVVTSVAARRLPMPGSESSRPLAVTGGPGSTAVSSGGIHVAVRARWGQPRQVWAQHSDAGSRLAVARSTNTSVRWRTGNPGTLASAASRLCGRRRALDPSRLRRRLGTWRNKRWCRWVSPSRSGRRATADL
jgi:hypothetical protein